jgi:hypothetical protein
MRRYELGILRIRGKNLRQLVVSLCDDKRHSTASRHRQEGRCAAEYCEVHIGIYSKDVFYLTPWSRVHEKLLIENCALLGYYAASRCNSLPTFRDNLSVPSSRAKNGTERLSHNVGNELPRLAAK